MSALEQLLLRAYLAGEMDASEVEAFELLMLERPELAELAEADMALRLGLANVAASPLVPLRATDDALRAPRETGSATAAVLPLRRRPAWPALALAASLLLVVGVGAGLRMQPGLVPMDGAQLAYVDKTRSISEVPALRLDPGNPVVLMVPVARLDDCEPRIRVEQQGQPTLEASALPDEFGYASLVLAKDALRAGRARVLVACGTGAVAEYPVDVTFAAPVP